MSRFTILFFERSYQNILRPILFQLDPELVHDKMTEFGYFLGRNRVTRTLTHLTFAYQHPTLHQEIAGLKFVNPIGLSAGFDKDANLVQIMPEVGFSYMEVGTVTTDPYTGNPGPRLWRLPNSKALVVNFGLKNIGVKRIIQKLRDYKRTNFVLGISIGMTNSVKNKSIEAGVEDYYQCLRSLVRARIGKLYVINISCPNTFGGEPYTTPNKLDKLLKKLTTVKTRKPVFVKMPINLSWLEFEALLKVIVKYPMAGVIIGNLNKDRSRSEIKDPLPVSVKGGISGLPTQALSNTLIGKTYRKYGKKLTIIGVGGVFSAKDAYTKIRLGASLVSLITGMIYQGPQLIGQINEELVGMLEKDGFKSLSEAVGADSRTS